MKVKARSLLFILLLLPILAAPWGTAYSTPIKTVREEPKPYGGTLIAPLPSDPSEFSVFLRASSWSFVFLDPIYDGLVEIGPNNEPVPWLAESWEVTEDGMEWTIHLVKNATWHDGTPFTAWDVKFTYDHCIQAKYPRWSDLWTAVNRTEVIDDYTIKMYLNIPYPDFVLEVLPYPIVPKHIWEPIVSQPDFDPYTFQPSMDVLKVGNGPFILEEYKTNVYAKYKANLNFFKGRPYVDELLMPIITSPDAMLLALKNGEIDVFTWVLPVEAVPSLIVDENIGIHVYKSSTMYHWGFNLHKFPFNVKQFRKVLAHCVNKREIVEVLLHGYGRPGRFGVYPPTDMFPQWLNPDPKCGVDGYEFNLTLAAQMLDEMGWIDRDGDGIREDPEGRKLEFEIGPPTYDPVRVRAAEMISDWLSQIGIKATVVYLEWKTLWKKITAPLDSPFKIDSWLLGSGLGIGSPDILRFRLHSSAIPNPNYYGFINATFDELAEAQAREVDPEKRAEIVRKMQEILAEELPLIVLYHRNFISAYRTDRFTGWVKPVQDGVNNQWSWMNVYLKELAVLKPMTISLIKFPAPEVTKGTDITVRIKLTDTEGNPITGARVDAIITGRPETYTLTEVGDGVYEITLSTSDWTTGSYTLKLVCEASGFESTTSSLTFELKEAAPPPPPPPPSFWEQYGPMIVGLVVVIAVIAVGAVMYMGRKS